MKRHYSLGASALALLLTACGGGGGSSTPSTTPSITPAATYSATTSLDIHKPLVVTFNEAMKPGSLTLGGTLTSESDGGVWSKGNTVLTISPDSMGAWQSGNQTLTISASDGSGHTYSSSHTYGIDFNISNFARATSVIGQVDLTSNDNTNYTVVTGANTFEGGYGAPSFIDGRLWVPDSGNSRVLGFDSVPATVDPSATYLIGQSSFSTSTLGNSASGIGGPEQLLSYNGYYYLLERNNNRILIYNSAPLSAPGTANAVIGQVSLTATVSGCAANNFNTPEAMSIAGGKLIVADGLNNRVLIWNHVPTTSGVTPDIVLGHSDFTHCDINNSTVIHATPSAQTLYKPSAVWSDGTRLVVSDEFNNRVLIWNSFPTSNFQPADMVLGQSDFTHNTANDDNQDGTRDAAPTARTLAGPSQGVWFNGRQLFVSDSANNRVLIWNTFPTSSFQPANAVLGQGDFTHGAINDDNQDGTPDGPSTYCHDTCGTPTARTLDFPVGGILVRDKLILIDSNNYRVLVYQAN